MFIPYKIVSKKKRSSKKGKFAIIINEQGRSIYYIRKLKYFLKNHYPFLKEECLALREKSVKAAKNGDYVLFGCSKKYDFRALSGMSYFEDGSIPEGLLEIDLESGWDLIKKTIHRYVAKNYPCKTSLKRSKKYKCHCI